VLKGNEIQTSSSNLLLLNVEDILGFAQLKAGKFTKVVKKFNIRRCIKDIISIQFYQAQSKNINMICDFFDFPAKNLSQKGKIGIDETNLIVDSDEKRIKQVLMNLQSNALKFTKEGGDVRILCQYIPKGKKQKSSRQRSKHDSYSSEKSSDSDASKLSEDCLFLKEHDVDTLFEPDAHRNKIVIEVMDSGIGIKRKDKLKLFKLFGCLQTTRQMNT